MRGSFSMPLAIFLVVVLFLGAIRQGFVTWEELLLLMLPPPLGTTAPCAAISKVADDDACDTAYSRVFFPSSPPHLLPLSSLPLSRLLRSAQYTQSNSNNNDMHLL
ncbi:hypothetical protein LX36DRAFT_490731 [Colletotrichum falcatum]|nr:hypothetical protein LX36DRAFT_490731 [Colletotrichum falcatum]